LGALSHYASDIAGHPAVNQAVAIEYPKLRAKFGKSVRYAQDKTAHLKTEFGFDTVQVAKNRYASQQYHDFIGFQVSKPLLERVFPVVYGVELKDVLTHEDWYAHISDRKTEMWDRRGCARFAVASRRARSGPAWSAASR
jgi:Zinc dependent phospholipase C